MAELRFYLDENVPLEVSRQLTLSGLDVVSAHSLERLGDKDVNHLRHATELGRVLCTHDQDFLRMTAEGVEHAGIAFLPQARCGVGEWVRGLRTLGALVDSEAAKRRVFFLPLR